MVSANFLSWPRRHPARAGAVAGWIQQIASFGSALLLIPVVTAALSPAQAGIWFVFQSLVGLISLLDLGFGFAISRQVAFTLGGGSPDKQSEGFLQLRAGSPGLSQLFKLTRQLYLCIALSGGIFALLAFEVMANFGQLLPSFSPDVRASWYALALAAMLLIFAGGRTAFLNGLGDIYQTRLLSAGYQVLAACGAAIAARCGLGLTGMGAAFTLAAGVHYLTIRFICKMVAPSLEKNAMISPPQGSLWKLAKAALPVGGVNIFGSLIYTAQTPLLGFLLGPEKIAPFYLAQKIALACNQAVTHTVSPQMPFFTRACGSGDFRAAARLMRATILRTTALVVAISVLFFFASPLAARLLLKQVDFLSSLPLALMAADLCLLGLTLPWAWFVLASGRNPFPVTTMVGGLLSLVGCFFLVPKFGISGMPASAIIAGLLTNYWFAVWCGRNLYRKLTRSGSGQPTNE